MVVPVLMINCQVSENFRNGPEIAHTTSAQIAMTKTAGLPRVVEARVVNRLKNPAALTSEDVVSVLMLLSIFDRCPVVPLMR